jgi:hypothetical protein
LNRGLITSSISWTQFANEKETIANMITPAPKKTNSSSSNNNNKYATMMTNLSVCCESLTTQNLDSTMSKIASGTPIHCSSYDDSRYPNDDESVVVNCIPTPLSTNETWTIFGDLGTCISYCISHR